MVMRRGCQEIDWYRFIPNLMQVPRKLVPQTQDYLTTAMQAKKMGIGQFSVPRAETSSIILSLDFIPRASRGFKCTLQLRLKKRERIRSWMWPGLDASHSIYFSCA